MPLISNSGYQDMTDGRFSGGNLEIPSDGLQELQNHLYSLPNGTPAGVFNRAGGFQSSGGFGVKKVTYNPLFDILTPTNTSDVNDDSGNRIGTINQDILNDAIRNLPNPLGGSRPPLQTGPIQSAPVVTPAPAPEMPTSRPDETGRVGDQFPTGGDGQVPDAPSGGGNNGSNPIFDILRQFPIFGGGGGVSQVPTGDNGGFGLDEFLGQILGGGGSTSQGGAATATGGNASNVLSDLIGAVTGGNASNSLPDLLSNVGNTVINAGATDYVADKQCEANKDALDFNKDVFQSGIDRLEPFHQSGLNPLPDLEAAASSNPRLRDLFQSVNLPQAGNRGVSSSSNLNYSMP